MKVHGLIISAGTQLVLMALAEKGAKHELVSLDFAGGEHKQPAYLALQPFAKVPAAEHDGFVLFESRAIARYIDEAFPGERFTPAALKERALMDQWISVEMMEHYPTAHALVLELVIKKLIGMGDPDPAKVEALRAKVRPVLAVLDKALEGKSYLVGGKFTLADMVYLPDLSYLHSAGEGAWISEFTNVTRWYQGIAARKSWQSVQERLRG
jgi:glutathione S-transferase